MLLEAPDVIVDEVTHEYSENGIVCPRSATGLLKKYGLGMDFSRIPPMVLEKARLRGNAVDTGMRLIASGIEINPETISPSIEGYLAAFVKFWRESSGVELIESGIPRISPLGFGFTPDLIIWLNGLRTVLDGKATFKMPKSVGPQTGFYKIGWNSMKPAEPIEARTGLWLKKDGTYKLETLDDPDDEAAAMDILHEDIRREEADKKISTWRKKYSE